MLEITWLSILPTILSLSTGKLVGSSSLDTSITTAYLKILSYGCPFCSVDMSILVNAIFPFYVLLHQHCTMGLVNLSLWKHSFYVIHTHQYLSNYMALSSRNITVIILADWFTLQHWFINSLCNIWRCNTCYVQWDSSYLFNYVLKTFCDYCWIMYT